MKLLASSIFNRHGKAVRITLTFEDGFYVVTDSFSFAEDIIYRFTDYEDASIVYLKSVDASIEWVCPYE